MDHGCHGCREAQQSQPWLLPKSSGLNSNGSSEVRCLGRASYSIARSGISVNWTLADKLRTGFATLSEWLSASAAQPQKRRSIPGEFWRSIFILPEPTPRRPSSPSGKFGQRKSWTAPTAAMHCTAIVVFSAARVCRCQSRSTARSAGLRHGANGSGGRARTRRAGGRRSAPKRTDNLGLHRPVFMATCPASTGVLSSRLDV